MAECVVLLPVESETIVYVTFLHANLTATLLRSNEIDEVDEGWMSSDYRREVLGRKLARSCDLTRADTS